MGKDNYNRIYKKIAIILYIVSLIMIVVGVSLLINNIFKSPFFDDVFNNQEMIPNDVLNEKMAFPIISVSVGGVLFFVATVLLFVDIFKQRTFSRFGKGLIDKVVNTASYMQTTYQEKVSEHKRKKIVYCKYCGSILDETEKKCPNCGASNLQK